MYASSIKGVLEVLRGLENFTVENLDSDYFNNPLNNCGVTAETLKNKSRAVEYFCYYMLHQSCKFGAIVVGKLVIA